MNIGRTNFVSPDVMKKILLLLSGLAAIPLFTSCADYGVYSATVARPIGGNPGFVGRGLAPLQVGFVATTFDRWAWDPYRRHWFDRRARRFFDPRLRSYCTVVPRRFATAVYPSGYRRGGRLACPSYLPRNTAVVNRGNRFGNNRGRFSPVVHGSSRGAAPLRGQNRSGNFNRGSDNRSFSNRNPVRRSVSPVPSRRSVNPSTVSRNRRLQTVSTNRNRNASPSRAKVSSRSSNSRGVTSSRSSSSSRRYTAPTVRSKPKSVVRRQTTPVTRSSTRSSSRTRTSSRARSQPSRSSSRSRSTPSVRSSGYSRRPSNTSRAINRVRKRTR